MILDLRTELWATGDTRKVAEGVLAADELIWKEHGNLNEIPGLPDHVVESLASIRDKGMLATVEGIL